MQSKVPTVWLIGLTLCLVAEGVWLLLTLSIAGFGTPLLGLTVLWLGIAISLGYFTRWPILSVLATCLNLIGCALIKTTPTNVHPRALFFFRMHSVDIAMILFAYLAYLSRARIKPAAIP
jgi:hypothetical protein